MVCKSCGANVGSEYRLCPYCGSEIEYPKPETPQQPIIIENIINNHYAKPAQNRVIYTQPAQQLHSSKDKTLTLILCIILGLFGGHCFYVGKTGMGVLYLLTGGLCGIGWIVDIIRIVTGSYTDSRGLPIDK